MGNETGYYFGAYIEIEVKKLERQEIFFACKNGHRSNSKFCSQCGSPVEEQTVTIVEYPIWINDVVVGDEWTDALCVITPPSLHQTGVIIAVGNFFDKPRGEWLYLDRWDHDIETKNFPTGDEISQMIRELESNYNEIITVLRNSPNVNRVSVRAGYVLDTDY